MFLWFGVCVFHFGLYILQCVVLMLVSAGVLFIAHAVALVLCFLFDLFNVVHVALWCVYVGVS